MKTVVVFGAGLVSRPLIRHLAAQGGVRLIVADQDATRAAGLIAGHPAATARSLDAGDEKAVDALVAEGDIVISLLPAGMHVPVARAAIRRGRDLVTTSYVSPAMAALDADARAAGVLVLCECGLDPGLDHMAAMRSIARLRAAGRTVVGFWSAGGGGPAPESDTNPWRYKFSWSPRGVLVAATAPARYLHDGTVVEIAGGRIFEHVETTTIDGLGAFEVYPNRDALPYALAYGISEARSVFRGTLRRAAWNETMRAVVALGLLDLSDRDWGPGISPAAALDSMLPRGDGSVRDRAARAVGLAPSHRVIERLAWAGLFSEARCSFAPGTALDLLCGLLEERLAYAPGERDTVTLVHRFTTTSGGAETTTIATLVTYGEPGGDTAMARAVSLPAAIAARLRLEGVIRSSGVRIPVLPEVYEPVLSELETLGLRFKEREA